MPVQMSEMRVPIFDFEKGDFAIGGNGQVLTATGSLAVAQIAIKAEQTQRRKYSVYGDYEDPTRNHTYGSDVLNIAEREDLPEAVRQSEMERAAEEAISYDPWVEEVTTTTYYQEIADDGTVKDMIDVTLTDVFGGSIDVKGVEINGY